MQQLVGVELFKLLVFRWSIVQIGYFPVCSFNTDMKNVNFPMYTRKNSQGNWAHIRRKNGFE